MIEDQLHCTKQCSKFRQAENNRLQGGFLHISWNYHEVALPIVFFFFSSVKSISLPELNKLAFIPEGIKPRNTPSIRIESSDWKDDLNAVVLPLVDKFVVHQSRR